MDRNRLFGPVFRGIVASQQPPILNPPAPRPQSNRLPIPAAPPPGKYPSTTVYYPPPQPPPSGQPPPGQPPPPYQPGGTPPLNPNAPNPNVPVTVTQSWPQFVLTQGMPYIIAGGRYAWDYYQSGRRPYETSGPRRRYRNRQGGRPARPPAGRGDPFPPNGPATAARRAPPREQPIKLDTIIVPRGRMVDPLPNRTIGQAEIIRDTRTAPPAPPPPKPLWQTLLPIIGPSLLGFLQPAQGNRTVVRLTDPLTQPQPGNGNPFPLTSPQTLVQSFGAFGGTPGAVGTNTCECKAPRKKGRKKKRTVCYSGTFIERRDGTRKTKKRKVQCL